VGGGGTVLFGPALVNTSQVLVEHLDFWRRSCAIGVSYELNINLNDHYI
jgi:hypothetical protein